MSGILPLALVSLISAWMLVLIALIFFEDGDDKRTLLLLSASVLTMLAVFTLLIPTYTVIETPAYNVITGNTITQYPAVNTTNINNALSLPVIALYLVFALFQAFIFFVLAVWSFKARIQFRATQQYKKDLGRRR